MNCGETDIFQSGKDAFRVSVLLIGYGNEFRSDDGAGPSIVSQIAAVFEERPRCQCITSHQLVPELAEDICRANRVIFIDASIEVPPGKVKVVRLSAAKPSQRSAHHVLPQAMLGFCRALSDHTPFAWSIAVGVADLCVGEHLTPLVSATATRLVRHLTHHINAWIAPGESTASPCAIKEGFHVCT